MYTFDGSDPGGRRGSSLVNVYKIIERGIEMGQTTMRLPVALKNKIEEYRKKEFGWSSSMALYDVIDSIMLRNENLKKRIQELNDEKKQMIEDQEKMFVYLGEELRNKFKKKQDELALKHDFQLMKVLLDHFESSGSITKYAFETYVRVREGAE